MDPNIFSITATKGYSSLVCYTKYVPKHLRNIYELHEIFTKIQTNFNE